MVLKIKRLKNFKGELPRYQTPGASGFDLAAALDEAIIMRPLERVLVPTGLSFEIPEGFEIQVRPRSGLAVKSGISLVNTPGTIDCDYRGEVKIILINLGQQDFVIQPGDRIAQAVVTPVVQAQFEIVSELSSSERAAGGFGSTGLKDQSASLLRS